MAERVARPRRLAALVLVFALLISAYSAAVAQSDVRYFAETGHTLRGAFRGFWEQNGALYTFGFPISEEFTAADGRTMQWFERARFELNEVNGQTRVDLGMLGVEATQGRVFPKVPPIENSADRRYIPETQHIIQYGFKEIWETRGDVRIFGFPISEEIDEILEDGQWHTVQYFERARFEYWPNLPPGERVLISHLGRRLAPAEQRAPVPPPGQAPAPAPSTPPPADQSVPPSLNARVTPESGPPGTTFVLDAFGFEPGESVGIWLTAPDQSTFGADFQVRADANGSIAAENVSITTDSSYPAGVWSLNAQGVRSGTQAVGFFRVTAAAAGDPNRLGLIAHDGLPRQGDVFMLPVAAPPGTPFLMLAGGYNPDESVSAWLSGPDGVNTPVDPELVTNDGGVVQALIDTTGKAEGIYSAVAYGQTSLLTNIGGLKLTRDYVAGPGTPRPANVNGSATPQEGPPGTRFDIRGSGLAPNEPAEVWITDPSGIYLLYPEPTVADASGGLGVAPVLFLQTGAENAAGIYGVHFRGLNSGNRIDVYITVTGNARGLTDPRLSVQMLEQMLAGALQTQR